MYSLKVTNDKEVRRASVAESLVSYAEVTRIIRSMFPALSRAPFYLQWRDEDDDWVTVSSEPELKEAVRHMSYTDGVLRFTVKVVPEHFGVTCDVCGVNPIPGTRYHCTVRHNYDLCSNCFRAAPQPYPMVKLDAPSAGQCPYRAGCCATPPPPPPHHHAPPAGPAFGHLPGHGGRFFAGLPHGGPAPRHPQGPTSSPPPPAHCRGGRRGPHCRGGRGAPWKVHPLLAALFGEPPAPATAASEKEEKEQQQGPKCPYQQARAHPFVVHLEDLFKELFVDEEAFGDEQPKQATASAAAAAPAAEAKAATADSSTSPSALPEAEALDATTILKHLFDVQDRDLNDEDEALQAAIDQSIRESTAGSTKSLASSISTDAPSASSADVNALPNYAGEDDAEEVYSEHSYSLVQSPAAAVATPVTTASATGPFSPPSAQQEAAKRAEKERLELEALSQLWYRELQLLGDMGFTNTPELIPLLQREIGAVPATQLGGQGSNSPQAVAAMQRVVATLLSNKREL